MSSVYIQMYLGYVLILVGLVVLLLEPLHQANILFKAFLEPPS